MKVRYYLEYISATTNKGVRADLGYDSQKAIAAAYVHLERGDMNVVIVPILEKCDNTDENNINIIDVEAEVRLDEIQVEKEPKKPND